MKAELALQEKQLAVAEKNKLYDRLALDCAPQLKKTRRADAKRGQPQAF